MLEYAVGNLRALEEDDPRFSYIGHAREIALECADDDKAYGIWESYNEGEFVLVEIAVRKSIYRRRRMRDG